MSNRMTVIIYCDTAGSLKSSYYCNNNVAVTQRKAVNPTKKFLES
jgi:hypothetical protein